MMFIWDVLQPASVAIDLGVITLIYALLITVFVLVVKRKFGYIFLSLSFIVVVLSYLFTAFGALIITAAITASVISVTCFANIGDLRYYIANPFKRANGKNTKKKVSKIFDRHATYQLIESTIKALSTSKTGALITFEKEQSLKEFSKNGVAVEAPISRELLTTIFYPGTRLHDGAVIIRGDMIAAASVFFTPSTKAFTAKYGSRHRAAIGISEVSDSVTVVVSEETGRISIAVNGQIESVSEANFLRVFENYMMDSSNE